jgi:hypothetical protein
MAAQQRSRLFLSFLAVLESAIALADRCSTRHAGRRSIVKPGAGKALVLMGLPSLLCFTFSMLYRRRSNEEIRDR